MRFVRLSGNTLKPHCEPNSISMNGVSASCITFSEMGTETGNHFQRPGDTRIGDKGLPNSGRGGFEEEVQHGLAAGSGSGKE